MLRGVVVGFIQGGGKTKMYSIWCLPYRPSELISQRRGRRHLRSYSVHKHNTQEKQERRASARPGDRSVLPPRRSLLVLSIASPSKSGTIPRSTSSQLTCLSLSAARSQHFSSGVFASQEIFFQQHVRLGILSGLRYGAFVA